MTTAASSNVFQAPSHVGHERDKQPPAGTPAAKGLDATTMIRALRSISAEILIDKLVETLMMTAVQHAGVERGVLIVRRSEDARVEAEATTRRHAIVVQRLDTLAARSDLPDTL